MFFYRLKVKIKLFFIRNFNRILSFFSVIVILSCFLCFGAFAASSSILRDDSVFYADPFITLSDDTTVNGSYTHFLPSDQTSSVLPPVQGKPIGIDFHFGSSEPDSTRQNYYSLTEGVLEFQFTFSSTQYFTSDAPTITFGYWDSTTDPDNPPVYESHYINSTDIGFSLNNQRVGSQQLWIVDVTIQIPAKYLTYGYFSDIYFRLTRISAAGSAAWTITSRSFSANILTGSDVPEYPAPDINSDDLGSAEGGLKDKLPSSDEFDSYFITDDLIDTDLIRATKYMGGFFTDLFDMDDTFDTLLHLLLSIGFCAFCINVVPGLVKSIATKSNKDTTTNSHKHTNGR